MNPATAQRAALYLRISTDKQATDVQEATCTAYALRASLPIASAYRDTASGARPWRDRGLLDLIDATPPPTDVIVYEYSRVGRDMLDTLDFLRECAERGISVHVAKNNSVVRGDISGKILATVMSLAAEIERDLLRQRTTDALADRQARIKQDGGFTSKTGRYVTKLGRPTGSITEGKLADRRAEILTLHAAKVPAAAIARLCACDPRTVKRLLISSTKTGT